MLQLDWMWDVGLVPYLALGQVSSDRLHLLVGVEGVGSSVKYTKELILYLAVSRISETDSLQIDLIIY